MNHMNLAITLAAYKRPISLCKSIDHASRSARNAIEQIEGLQASLCVWNNDRECQINDDTFKQVKIPYYYVNSSFNGVCIPRYHMPFAIEGAGEVKFTHFLIVDDDIAIGPQTIIDLISAYNEIGDNNALLGTRGAVMTLTDGGKIRAPRYEGPDIELIEADYLSGHCMFGDTKLLKAMIMCPPDETFALVEDMWFMLVTQRMFNTRKYIIPTKKIRRLSSQGYTLNDKKKYRQHRGTNFEKLLREEGWKFIHEIRRD